jgi:hypothetical protein
MSATNATTVTSMIHFVFSRIWRMTIRRLLLRSG